MSSLLSAFQLSYNSTLIDIVTPTKPNPPFYYTTRPSIFPFIPDIYLSVAAPVIAYWGLSTVFLILDTVKLPYFEARRIHESNEIVSRNKATVPQVVRAVFWQHVVQTILGLIWLADEPVILNRELYVHDLAAMAKLAPHVVKATLILLGGNSGEQVLRNHGQAIVQWVYWWGIPFVQLMFSFFLVDTWQYFFHRLCHTSTFLYRRVHAVHHRLYVPYAFGALYNHPVEGFVFDSLGTAVAHALSMMNTRQACFLFTVSTLKTVDDHCGYKLWWDPCQFLFSNNADYHDIHHQTFGIKSNYAQPFFTNWDKLLGTHMSREEAATKTRRTAKVD